MQTLTILGGGSAYTPGLLQALIAHVAELPLTTVGKIDKKVLRAPFWAGQARQVG